MITNNSNRVYFKGYCRGIVLIKGRLQFIPNDFIDYLQNDSNDKIVEYENFIKQNQFKVLNSGKKEFNWDSFSLITNVNCEVNNNEDFKNIEIFQNVLLSKLIIIRITDLSYIKKFLEFFVREIYVDVYLIINFKFENNDFLDSIISVPNITKIFINSETSYINSKKIYTKSTPNKFTANLIHINPNFELINESRSYHTYFNRKLYISSKGEIKNAKECSETFGNIGKLSCADDLVEIISTSNFQKYWYVHKDICDVCKHCEFRHVCVDVRIPYERSINKWFHKVECNYNPFIAKWKGENGYKNLKKCGVISNETEFSIDHEKIKQINHVLWGE